MKPRVVIFNGISLDGRVELPDIYRPVLRGAW